LVQLERQGGHPGSEKEQTSYIAPGCGATGSIHATTPLRQYFPKGTDLSAHSTDDLAAVAAALNARHRKTLGWKTPAEMLDQFLRSAQTGRVATTS
jgi:hypothetical protein